MELKDYIKKGICCLMLIAYVLGILKPLTPLAKNLFAHTFDKAHHMATVHFENGKYHVHKEMAQDTPAGNAKKSASEYFSSEELLASHLHSDIYLFKYRTSETSVIQTMIDTLVPDSFMGTATPPPKG